MAEVQSHVSRRKVMIGMAGGAAAAAVTLTGAARAQSGGGKNAVPLVSAGYSTWAGQVGTNFTAHTGHVLKLVQVQAYGSSGSVPAGVRNPGFLARFDITRGSALAAGRYLVAHPTGGTFEIYLSKSGPTYPMRMLADFN
jgi:hypothetical protein